MRVDDPYHVKRVEETLKQLKTQYRFGSSTARVHGPALKTDIACWQRVFALG